MRFSVKGFVCILVCFCVSLDQDDFGLLVLFCLLFSVGLLSQEIGWEERLRNDPFGVE